jgi:hypothetical protein
MTEINDGHYLEVMDRIHVAVSMIDEHILAHPLLEHHPLIQEKVEEAIEKLLCAYQKVGSIMPTGEGGE